MPFNYHWDTPKPMVDPSFQASLTELIQTTLAPDQGFILVDIGASGDPPPIWQELAFFASYIGFDPDARELNEANHYGFQDFKLVKKIVTDGDANTVKFFLTDYPYCSSTLKPDMAQCAQYTFTETFVVNDQTEFPAMRLDQVMTDLDLDRLDWLKLDSQGKDLDLFLSIHQTLRSRILAIDIEPGVIPFYEGENTFSESHQALLDEGFWLASLQLQNGGFARIHQSTRQALADYRLPPDQEPIDFMGLPVSPTALEARYFRSLESLIARGATIRDFLTLWMFALCDQKLGFALDVAMHLQTQSDCSETSKLGQQLLQLTLTEVNRYQKQGLRATQHTSAHRF